VTVVATAAATAVSTVPVLEVHNRPAVITGGRMRPCDLASNLKRLLPGCEIISSVSAPGARVVYTIAYPRVKGRSFVQTFEDRADARGHSLHAFNVAYLPPVGARAGSPATVALVTVAATLASHPADRPTITITPVSFLLTIVRLQVHTVPAVVTGGRTAPCDLASNLKHLVRGCAIVSSDSAPGAKVVYVITYPKVKGRSFVQIFAATADAQGRSLRAFNVPYVPPVGVKAGSPAAVALVTVLLTLPGHPATKVLPVSAPLAISR
jgi:hypothetical protein